MKDIPGYEGLYAATTCGKIWSHKRKKFLSQAYSGNGYLMVCLYGKDGKKKTHRVNRLVALTYLPNPDNLSDVAHLDDCRTHNWLGNLAWMSRKDNLATQSYKEKAKVKTHSKVRCVETGEVFADCAKAAAAVGVVRYGVNSCLLGYQKTAGGYHWERVIEEDE